MRTPVTWLAFFVGLIVLFGIAISLGEVVGGGTGVPGGDGSQQEQAHPPKADLGPDGLSISDQGYVLVPAATRFVAGETSELHFSIFTADRARVTDYGLLQGEKMQLILVRRDMTEYQFLTPTLESDGTWSVPVRLPEPGSYRAFVTFLPGKTTQPVTLGVDLESPGEVEPEAVPQPREIVEVDGYTVMLNGTVVAGGVSRLYATVLQGEESVTDLDPYLGARGHLVMFREGDLGLLRVRPVPVSKTGPTISFEASVPTPGYYRIFLDFQHHGELRTAEFTVLAS